MTFEDYKAQILAQYATARKGEDSDFLDSPSPARLKELCLLLLERGLSPADEEVFVRFFGGERDTLYRRIEGFDIDKLRPVRNFLMGKTDLTRPQSANLAAIVVDYGNRPFARFRNGAGPMEWVRQPQAELEISTHTVSGERNRPKGLWLALALIVLLAIGGFSSAKYLMRPQCMQWQGDHYRVVDCGDPQTPGDLVEPLDQSRLRHMKQIIPCDTTVFFRNGKPVIWYDKYRKKVEFFTMPGLHPQNGRTLKPITPYMIDKYVKTAN